MLDTAQFAAFHKANLDLLLGIVAKSFEGVERLTALNLQLVKTGLGQAAEISLAALSVKEPQALLTLEASMLPPAAEMAATYGRQVYKIVAGTKAAVEELAAERTAGAQNSFMAAIDAATKNAPEGSSSGIVFFKSAVAAANSAFDGLQKASRQAAKASEVNYITVSGPVAKVSGKAKRG